MGRGNVAARKASAAKVSRRQKKNFIRVREGSLEVLQRQFFSAPEERIYVPGTVNQAQ